MEGGGKRGGQRERKPVPAGRSYSTQCSDHLWLNGHNGTKSAGREKGNKYVKEIISS